MQANPTATYALIVAGLVHQVFAGTDMPEWNEAQITAADITAVAPPPQLGWSATETNGIWAFAAPPTPPAATLAQQAATMLAAGCQIVSTGTPALNGTYFVDAESRADVQAEVICLLLNGTFTNGGATLDWPDASGAPHAFDVAQFKAFATALGAFVGTLKQVASTNSGTLPAQPVTIA